MSYRLLLCVCTSDCIFFLEYHIDRVIIDVQSNKNFKWFNREVLRDMFLYQNKRVQALFRVPSKIVNLQNAFQICEVFETKVVALFQIISTNHYRLIAVIINNPASFRRHWVQLEG